jgi:formylglycine-generating enzyme required for sulfatase activity
MPNEKRPLKVFLCHASLDKPKVRELYRYLRRRGIRPWFDEVDLVGGQDWQVEIPKALLTSDAIIICLTKNSVDREGYIQKEIKFALDKALEMPEGRIFLIPVRFEECEVPFSLTRYQWVDLFDEAGYARMMRALKFRASQLERATVELPQKDIEEEKLALEKVAREKEEHEAAEKAARETAERKATEQAEHETAEKAAREKLEHEAAEKTRREKAEQERLAKEERKQREREAAEKAKREKDEKEKLEKARQAKLTREVATKTGRNNEDRHKALISKTGKQIAFWIVGFAALVLGIGLLSSLNGKSPPPEPTATNTRIVSISQTPSRTSNSTLTLTPESTSAKIVTPTPSLVVRATMVSEKDGMVMVYVPKGDFIMGTDNGYAHEGPAHNVYLEAFWIDQTEVTMGQFTVCVQAEGCARPIYTGGDPNDFFDASYSNYPMKKVDWSNAKSYCQWVGRRLPTEAEWEKAARGVDGRIYPWEMTRPLVLWLISIIVWLRIIHQLLLFCLWVAVPGV